jgi:IS5 family transposase
MKLQKLPTLADTICDLRARKIKTTFFTQINGLIDWDSNEKLIEAITLRRKVLW